MRFQVRKDAAYQGFEDGTIFIAQIAMAGNTDHQGQRALGFFLPRVNRDGHGFSDRRVLDEHESYQPHIRSQLLDCIAEGTKIF
jgi:hypothetical protein